MEARAVTPSVLLLLLLINLSAVDITTGRPPAPPKISPAPAPSSPSHAPKISPAPAPLSPSHAPKISSPAPAPESPRPEEGSKGEASGLSRGQKAGIAVGCLVGAAFAGMAAWVYKKRRHNIQRSRYAKTVQLGML